MRRFYLCLGLVFVFSVVLLAWLFRSPSVPPLPTVPQLRNALGDAFALGVIGHTNDAAGNELVSFFFANPKDDVSILTTTVTERYDLTTGRWTSVPHQPRQQLRIAPRSTQAFYLRRPEGDSPWRVVLTPQAGSIATLIQSMQTKPPGNRPEFRTPVLVGVNVASNELGAGNGNQPIRSETIPMSPAAGSRR
jgi:hypothetical protein